MKITIFWFRYFIIGDFQSPFEIDYYTGWVRTTEPLDREQQESWNLQILVEDGGPLIKNHMHTVLHVRVIDIDDNIPFFLNNRTSLLIPDKLYKGDVNY